MNDATKQIVIAVAASAAAAASAALIANYFAEKRTLKDVASGKTPLPPGSTPTTTSGNKGGDSIFVPESDLQRAANIAQSMAPLPSTSALAQSRSYWYY